MIGRRASYLNPIRMYVFTSALFFLIFFSMFSPGENAVVTKTFEGKTKDEILAMDAAAFDGITKKLNDGIPMSRESFITYADSVNRKGGIRLSPTKFASKEAYDSLLRSGKKKHNWIERTLTYKQIEINKKYDNDQQKIVRSFINTLIHSFPQMLFLSLPVFALLLKLLYYRRKEYFYASHAIFSIHLYVFIFIILLIIAALSKANNSLNWAIIDYLSYALLLFFVFYEYKAMRVFYDQNRGKTILKFVILNLLHLFVLVLLFIFFVFFSLMKI